MPTVETSVKPLTFHHDLSLSLGKASLKFFLLLYHIMDLLGTWELSIGGLISRRLQALVIRWPYMERVHLEVVYWRNFTLGVLNSISENLSNVQIGCSWLKAILKRLLIASWIVSWDFSIIYVDSFTWGLLYFSKCLFTSFFLVCQDHATY